MSVVGRVGLSMLAAVAGGTTWVVLEPGTRSFVAEKFGIGQEAPVKAEPTTNPVPEPLDLTRHPDARPSFNCDDASQTIEHLICADPAIAEADRSLSRIWRTLGDRGLVTDELRLSQRQWLARRDACLIDDDPKACVKKTMLDRIAELSTL